MFERRAEAAEAPADLVARDALDEAASCSSGNAREFFRLLEGGMDRADELGRRRVEAADVARWSGGGTSSRSRCGASSSRC
jgi:hypothetical protein